MTVHDVADPDPLCWGDDPCVCGQLIEARQQTIRDCIALESSVGKSHSAEQIGPVCNILSYGVIGGIHRIPARNEQHNAAGAHFIKRLGKEIVVNR